MKMHGQLSAITFCGYDTLPFLANTEGEVYHWDKLIATFKNKARVHIACAKVNEDVPIMNRYISFYLSGIQNYSFPLLYRFANDELEPIKWNPLSGNEIFLKIEISAKVIGILFIETAFTLNLYSIENFDLIQSIVIKFPSTYPLFKLDAFGNVLLSTSVRNEYVYFYGPKYQFNKTVVLFQESQGFYSIDDVGWYKKGGTISKFIFGVIDMREINVTRHHQEVEFKFNKDSAQVVVDIKELKVENDWLILCDARQFKYDNYKNCFVEIDQCVINETEFSQSSCLQEHKSGLGLIKMVYVVGDGSELTLTYFEERSDEENKRENNVVLIILAVLFVLLLIAMAYLRWRFVSHSKGKVTLYEFFLCECCKKSKTHHNLDLEKEDTYSQLSD